MAEHTAEDRACDRGPCWKLRDHEDPCEPGSKNDPRRAAESPIAWAIDRALASVGGPPRRLNSEIRDVILAEIEAEFGPITVEERFQPGVPRYLYKRQTRIRSEWRAKS